MNRWKLQDPWLFLLALAASFIGFVMIFDAGFARAAGQGKTIPPEFMSQMVWFGFSMASFVSCSRVSKLKLQRFAVPLWILALLLLGAVLVPGLRYAQGGAYRWVKFGPIQFQPAEFAKLATILFLAAIFAERKRWPKKLPKINSFASLMDKFVVPKLLRSWPAVVVLVAIAAIIKEPDLGTGAVILAVLFAMLWCGRVRPGSLAALAVLCAFGLFVAIKAEPYRFERIRHHNERWSDENVDEIGYQTVQSELSQANGGVFGVGPGAGRAKHVLPATTNDFIMATVGEDFGFVFGALPVLGVLFAIVYRLLLNASRVKSRFAMLYLTGVATWIGVQACTNVMMANGLLPAIGIPLPFISSGGSSLVALWAAIGLGDAMLAPEPVEEGTHANRGNGWWNRRSRLSGA